MSEYRKMFQLMLEQNQNLFDEFRKVHDLYVIDPNKYQTEYNQTGAKVMDVVIEYERKLCIKMGSGKYGLFSSNLSEKFRGEIRKIFPKFDFIGVQMT
jgi:hypothetical protein